MVQESSSGTTGTMRYSRSISQLKLWTKCGELFYLERFKRSEMPRRPAAWTILGITLHDTIMEWEKSGRRLDLDEYFDRCYDQEVALQTRIQPNDRYWMLPPRTNSVRKSIIDYKKRGFKQLEKYVESVRDAPWEVSYLEKQFTIGFEGNGDPLAVNGGIDRILYFPGTDEYVVEDLKTGSPEDEEDKRQLAFYAFVGRELWGIPVKLGRYWYTKVDRPSETVNLEKYDKNFWARTFQQLDEAISREIFLPSPGKQCFLCSVRPWCSVQGWLNIGEELGG